MLLGAVVSAVCVGVEEERWDWSYSDGTSGTISGDSARRLLNEC